jgi:hypothetical protein
VIVAGTGVLSATVGSGLTVTFSSTTPTICTLSGTTVTGVAVGSCIVAANQAGNANYSPAPQITQTIMIGAALGVSPTSLVFSTQLVGTTSPTQTVTLSNLGTAALNVGQIAISAGFTHPSKTCASTLAPGASCTIRVAFAPKAVGLVTGTLTVGAIGSVALSGTAIAPAAGITPVSFDFRNQQVGTTSVVQTFTYSNTGPVSITVSSVGFGGQNPLNFVIVADGCTGVPLAPSATCNIDVLFKPNTVNVRSATLNVVDVSGGAPVVKAALLGTGIAPSVNLGTGPYAFGAITVPTIASFTLANTGSAPFAIGSIRLASTAHFRVINGSCSVGALLAAGASCAVSVQFTPSGTNSFSDSLTVRGTGLGVGAPTYRTSVAMTGS